MKKSAFFCGFILGVFLMGSTMQAETVGTTMNFRADPMMTGSVIGSVPQGATVTVLKSQNGWDYISYNGVNGWIHGGNVSSQPAASTSASATGTAAASSAGSSSGSSGQTVKVLYGMNFRATPGMDGRIMGGVPAGTKVQLLGSSNGWDKIVYNGVTGWIASGRTTAVGSTASAAASVSTGSSSSSGQTVKVLYGMNFRATPGMDGRIMGGIPAGTSVQYLGSSNGWDKVVYNGATGWIASGRTTTEGTANPAPALSSAAGTTKSVINTMNFRATGDLGGALIGLIPAGAKVTYVSNADGWEQVIYNGLSGWIKGGNTTIQ